MNTNCEVVRDILPLYADDVCSEASRAMIEAHLLECPDCAAYLKEIRSSEAEGRLKDEKALVIRHQARRFKRRSAAVGSVISALFMIPILVCLVVNLTSGRTLDWFYVVAAGMLVAASLVVVPLTVPEDKLFWTFCAFVASLLILLAVCCLYSHGRWFYMVASATLFGLSAAFLPFVVKARPLQKWIGGLNRTLLVAVTDFVLFGNMMYMISLYTKGFSLSGLMAALLIAAIVILAADYLTKGRGRR